MARYLLVDDEDGRILVELASPEQAMRLLARLDGFLRADPHVSLVRLDDQQGELFGVSSHVAMRLLAPLVAHPAAAERSADSRGPRPARRPGRLQTARPARSVPTRSPAVGPPG